MKTGLFNPVLGQKLVDWLVRPTTVARSLLGGGVLLLTAGGGPLLWGVLLGGAWPITIEAWTIALQQSPVSVATHWAMLTFGCTFLIGSGWYFFDDRGNEVRQVVIAVEISGLRDLTAPPLVEAVPISFRGTRMAVTVDLRQNIVDGELSDPQRALAEVSTLPARVKERCFGRDRRDIQVVAGGLAPVPLLFLAGVLLDDESEVSLLDWDRYQDKWRKLDGNGSGKRLQTTMTLSESPGKDVALCISMSNRSDLDSVSSLGLRIIHLELPRAGTAQHWAESDQEVWGRQFLETAIALETTGVPRIHLFVAAPSSVVLRMGRLYDKRNLPALRVYQFQRSTEAVFLYPWSIEMPVAARSAAEVVISHHPEPGQRNAERHHANPVAHEYSSIAMD